jgi:hypothetical protein
VNRRSGSAILRYLSPRKLSPECETVTAKSRCSSMDSTRARTCEQVFSGILRKACDNRFNLMVPVLRRAMTHPHTRNYPSIDGQCAISKWRSARLEMAPTPFHKMGMEPSCAVLVIPSRPAPTHLSNGPRTRRARFHEWALLTPEAVEGMNIVPGPGHSRNTIGALVRPSPMIVKMGWNRPPGRFGRGKTPYSNGHGPLIRWPVC